MAGQTKAIPLTAGSKAPARDGGKMYSANIPLAAAVSYAFTQNADDIGLDACRGLFVDNSNNSQPITISCGGTSQQFVVPPYSQANFPIFQLAYGQVQLTFASTGAVDVPIGLLNFEPQLNIWNSRNVATGTVVSGTVTTTPQGVTSTDKSSTITAGNTAQTMMVGLGTRKGLIISNPSTAALQGIATAESLFVKFGTTATYANAHEIPPGGSLTVMGEICPTQAVSVIAASTGHKYAASEFA
jgi:hypothetical protein